MLKASVISIGLSLFIFCLIGIIFDFRAEGNFSLGSYGFTKMVIACVVIGLGFGVPSVVYDSERISRPVAVLIHMGTGCVIYTVTAFLVGWISVSSPLMAVIITGLQIVLAFVIWLFFLAYYRKEARIMNEKFKAGKRNA